MIFIENFCHFATKSVFVFFLHNLEVYFQLKLFLPGCGSLTSTKSLQSARKLKMLVFNELTNLDMDRPPRLLGGWLKSPNFSRATSRKCRTETFYCAPYILPFLVEPRVVEADFMVRVILDR